MNAPDTAESAGGWPWARLALSLLLAAGTTLAAVLTHHHENLVYGDGSAVLANCPETETVDCDTVNTSAWSEMLGVPIAAFAIPTYLLVLTLVWKSLKVPSLIAHAFCIGMLATLYSAFLYYISSTRIGFICLYCVSLYGVNVAIPVLTTWAARRSPLSMIRTTVADLMSWPRALRFTSFTFAALLALTIGVQQAYRAHVQREAAAERERMEEEGGPLVPAGPVSLAPPPGARPAPSLFFSEAIAAGEGKAQASGPYKLAGPLRRIEKGPRLADFNLQAKLGAGKPVALIFWSPGYRQSERMLVEMTRYLKTQLPALDVYAVTGRNKDDRDEEVLEGAMMLGLPSELPLLIDGAFAVSIALNTTDVPNLALFDGKGRLIVSKIKSLGQKLVGPSGTFTAEETMRKIVSGTDVAAIQQMSQYFPATELYGRCAPEINAKKFDSAETVRFTGRPASGKPLMLMFWSATCKHCQVEIPLLVSWLKKNPGRVEVLTIARMKPDKEGRASNHDITKAYIKQEQMPWPVLDDPDAAIMEVYRSISTPTTYFISPQGTVVHAWFYPHPNNFDKAMEEVLAKVQAGGAAACRPLPEAPAPRVALDMLAPDGSKATLASRLDRPTLLHLWATWCPPCIEEIPSILQFGQTIEKAGDGRLLMLSVEDAASGEKIAGFARKLGLQLQSYRSPSGGLAAALDLSYRLPRTYLVAPNGVLVGSWQGNQKWNDPSFAERALSRLRNASALGL